jgi:hypothetical protein
MYISEKGDKKERELYNNNIEREGMCFSSELMFHSDKSIDLLFPLWAMLL